MNKTKLMFAAIAACVALAGCQKKDFNSITGTTNFTSVALSNDSTAYHLAVGDIVSFAPVATIEPQGTVIGNGLTNMTFAFSDPAVAEINSDGNLQADAAGTSTLTITYTDVDHSFTTSTLAIPITVTAAP
jgi:outer membrane lipoprotein SlyB